MRCINRSMTKEYDRLRSGILGLYMSCWVRDDLPIVKHEHGR